MTFPLYAHCGVILSMHAKCKRLEHDSTHVEEAAVTLVGKRTRPEPVDLIPAKLRYFVSSEPVSPKRKSLTQQCHRS